MAEKKAAKKAVAPKKAAPKKASSTLPPAGSAERKAMVLRGELKE